MIVSEKQVFNLMDTNGRRNDVSEALQCYLEVLHEVRDIQHLTWGIFPNSLGQFEYYRRVLNLSSEVFKKDSRHEELMEEIKKFPALEVAIDNLDIDWINSHINIIPENIIRGFEQGGETRARHLSSNLVKMGFADNDRNITSAGFSLLNSSKIEKDELEKLLIINNINIVYLRQLLKLKVFDKSMQYYYSPFCMAIYILLKNPNIEYNTFKELVQGLTPYTKIEDIDEFIDNYQDGDICNNCEVKIPNKISFDEKFTKDDFKSLFYNGKSNEKVDIYWNFYDLLWTYENNSNEETLDNLLDYYESQRELIKKAFGMGKNFFQYKKGMRPSLEVFKNKIDKIKSENINEKLYTFFMRSKKLDAIREYGDTTKRIFNITGIVDFSNGCVALANREMLECLFDVDKIKNRIFGNVDGGEYTKVFESVNSFSNILGYTTDDISNIITKIKDKFGETNVDNIKKKLTDERISQFNEFIDNNFPLPKVKEIMSLFADRKNDNKIKKLVSKEANVPTIYEYMVGIAWYYFSGKTIDLWSSYGMTLSADFLPLLNAGGGQGDIVIKSDDKVVMLEATLMNANAQKRGEWEPVLRHSINLKIDEEYNDTKREVTTFFIADSFDNNTINIWKAIAAVPLESSTQRGQYTENVVIMPVSSNELCLLMDKSDNYDSIIKTVHDSFEVEKRQFNMNWRKELIEQIM